jgi:hypothetical protein
MDIQTTARWLALSTLCSIACGPSYPAVPADASIASDSMEQSVTFTNVYVTILQPTCGGCHQPAGEGPFQDFSSQSAAYAALVGVMASGPSCGASGETRVVPGNASQSLLIQKVSEAMNPPCGSQMPLGGPALSSAQVMLLEAWVNSGAPND